MEIQDNMRSTWEASVQWSLSKASNIKKMDHNEEQNEEKIQNLNDLQCVGRSQHYKNLDD